MSELVLTPPAIWVRLSRTQFVLQAAGGECMLLTLSESVSDSALDVLEVLLDQCSTRVQHQAVVEQLQGSAWLERGYEALSRERTAQCSRRIRRTRREQEAAAAEARTYSGAAESIATGGKMLSHSIKRGAELISGGIEFGNTVYKCLHW